MKNLSKELKIKSLRESIENVRTVVYKDLLVAGIDPDSMDDSSNILEQLDVSFSRQNTANRFNRAYQLWASGLKIESHFMYETCTTRDSYMNYPISEEYGNNHFHSTLNGGGMFDTLAKHDNLIVVDGLFAITYTETTDKDLFRNLRDLHPFCVGHTIHELFKLMMEWQWAHDVLGSQEPMAALCNSALSHMGISYSDDSEVATGLMSLPDSFVAQYIKGEEMSVPINDPQQPTAFKLWLVDKGIMNFSRVEWANLYANCINIQKMEEKLSLLEGN
jgi:hypothetical protein